jgi:hypothetical protein
MTYQKILNKELIVICGFIFLTSLRFHAQHTGGLGDGFSNALYMSGMSIFVGSANDGFDVSRFTSTQSIYEGAAEDGFDFSRFTSTQSIYVGAAEDGFDLSQFTTGQSLFNGADNDGFDLILYHSQQSIFVGNSDDGFDFGTHLHYNKWTGLVGTGWLIAGNWEHNIVPNDSIRVRIPPGVPNIPKINAGTFKIGTAIGANFTCKALWIEPGATILCRINAFIENHSSILIDGTFQWKNQAANSFINQPGASILIRNGGVLKTVF